MTTVKPTEAELSILNVLWTRGPSTVRDVLERLAREREKEVGYTTVLKLLQIMTDKGLVLRDDAARSHVYRAVYPKEATQRLLLTDLLERAFAGSASQLVLQALHTQKASPEELAAIRALLDSLEDA